MNAREAYVIEEERSIKQGCDLRDPAEDDHGAAKEFAVKYDTHEAPAKGGVLTRQRGRTMQVDARPTIQRERRWRWHNSAAKSSETAALRPILRHDSQHSSTRQVKEPSSPRSSKRFGLLRRRSFTAHPSDRLLDRSNHEDNAGDALLQRSQSMPDVGNRTSSSRRVTFHDHVEVHTIDSVRDIPYEVRRALWMSRSEMLQSIQEAAGRAWEERWARKREDFARFFPLEEDDDDERSDDGDSDDANDFFKQEETEDEEEFMNGLLWQPKRSVRARG